MDEKTGRIIDPTGILAGRVVDPENVAAENGTDSRGADSGDDFARDDTGAVKRNKDGSPQRKRGRKPGVSNRSNNPSAKSKSDIGGIENILFSLHMMAAATIGAPELVIDEKEANKLAVAIQNVQDFYSFKTSAEIMLWVNFVGALGSVYGPRAVAIYSRKHKSKDKKEPEDKPTANIQMPIEGITVPHHAPTQ